MPRYIEEETFVNFVQEHFCNGCNNYNGIKCKSCSVDDAISMVESAPTADVVPRSEVQRIFEELYNSVVSKIPMLLQPIFKDDMDFDGGFYNGKRDALLEVLVIIAELKKKYVTDTNVGNKVFSKEIAKLIGDNYTMSRDLKTAVNNK